MAEAVTSDIDGPASSASGNVCPECGSDQLRNDYESSEVVCGSCGLVVRELSEVSDDYSERTGRGMTFPHLPDKNLTTTFRPEDVKDDKIRLEFRRLRGVNRRIPQRSDGWAFYRRAKELRPFLERVYPPFDLKAKRQDKISKVLEFASRLTSDRPLPQSLPRLKEAFAVLCIVQADPNMCLRQEGNRARFVGLEGLINRILRDPDGDVRTFPELPLSFTIKSRNGQCTWTKVIRFQRFHPHHDGATRTGEINESHEVELLVTLTMADQSFTVGVPITICPNIVGRSQPATEHRRLDEFTVAFLTASKQKCRVGESVKVTLRLQPAPARSAPIQGTLSLRTERTRAVIMETYERLCHHYGLPLTPLTHDSFIESDVELKPEGKERAKALAAQVDEAFRSRLAIQRLPPEVVASIAVIEATGQSVIDVAYRYRVDPGNLRNKLKIWHAHETVSKS